MIKGYSSARSIESRWVVNNTASPDESVAPILQKHDREEVVLNFRGKRDRIGPKLIAIIQYGGKGFRLRFINY